MSLPHRIAAGAIVLKEEAIVLVRYRNDDGTSYLVPPGGAATNDESVADAAAREVLEETGLQVSPRRVLFIEDLICNRYKMCKIWLLCDLVSGELRETEGAKAEGIVEAGWFHRADLECETVYPPPIKEHHWSAFTAARWDVRWLEPRRANF